MKNFKEKLEKVLKKEKTFLDEDGELDYIKIKDSADKIDEKLIKLLASEKSFREKFFTVVKEFSVFNINDFKFFLDENKVNNSYTEYKNRIGLSDGTDFLKDRTEVILDFPFKDCVLEGGQSSEDGTDTYFEYEEKKEKKKTEKGKKVKVEAGYKEKQGKRKEIFFNSILAKDEIDRLFDNKALINWKRFTKKGEEKVGEIKRDKEINKKRGLPEDTITENLVIKGNNLLALHSLKSEFAGKVKLIYIDPPYNTGNDGFKYNDNFNHSTWLTFMKNRLEIAKELLSDDGVIFVQIDNSPTNLDESPEFGYLLVLMDNIFKRKNYIGNQIWKKKGNASNTESVMGTITENILMYSKSFNKVSFNLQEYKRKYKFEEDGKMYNLEKPLKTNSGTYKRETMLFGIKTKEGVFYPPENKRWTIGEDTAKKYVEKSKYKIIKGEFYIKKFVDDYKKGDYKLYNNLLLEHGSLKSAKDELSKLGFNREVFDSPKPEILIKRFLNIVIEKNDIVLDFFAGSGTTGAVAHKMNRQYLLIEQMDYIKDLPEARLKKVIDGEQGGISKSVNWKGGGDFVYFELAEWNEKAKEEILKAKNLKELVKFFDKEMYQKYFLNYNVKIKEFSEKIVKEENFLKLDFKEQQKMFIAMLDNNQMYVNASEIEDKKFNIDKEDMKLTKSFYNKK